MQKNYNIYVVILILAFCLLNFSGCATVPTTEALPTYNIDGITYIPLISLCEQRQINWEYDTFTKTIVLNKDTHRINLRVGDTLALVDGSPKHQRYPPDIYQGTIVVPYRFKEQILDVLFKETRPSAKPRLSLLGIKKVVVDAGHGGNDPGAIGRTGLREKDVNLDIAKRLTKLLKSDGVEVVMTRSSDRFIPLSTRVERANNSDADLFVSIHANANRVRSLSGFEIYYIASSVNDAQRAYAAAQEVALNLDNASFASNSLDLKATLWDMIYTANRQEAIELSRSICHTINNNLDARILGIKGARYEVLRDARMPAVLIEVGFLSNYNDERKLKNGSYRQQIAEAIAEGMQNYAHDTALTEVASR